MIGEIHQFNFDTLKTRDFAISQQMLFDLNPLVAAISMFGRHIKIWERSQLIYMQIHVRNVLEVLPIDNGTDFYRF